MQDDDFAYIQRLVEQVAGIVLEKGKEYLAELRLTTLARQKGYASAQELVRRLREKTSPNGLHAETVEAMTINETTFFRDAHPFEAFKTVVLPSLIRNRSAERRLSFWCAAASSGQEPYSVAMLIREHFPELASWRLEFLASDISAKMLARASEGVYSSLEINRGLSAAYLTKYFDKRGADWQVKAEIRRMVDFRPVNLIQEWPSLLPQDVVFIRNVMIYFDVPRKRRILDGIARLLRPDGYLFLGGAETTINLSDSFERVPYAMGGCFHLTSRPLPTPVGTKEGNP